MPRRKNYILVDKNPVEVTLKEWMEWVETNDVHIQYTVIGDVEVSTMFLGMDHKRLFSEGPPILFETMIFGGVYDRYQRRCATYDQAIEMHKTAVFLVTQDLN